MERSPWLVGARFGAAAWFVAAAAAWSVAHADNLIPVRVHPLASLLTIAGLALLILRALRGAAPQRLPVLAVATGCLVAGLATLLAGSPAILILVARETVTVALWLTFAGGVGALLLGARVAEARAADLALAAITGLCAQLLLGLGLATWGGLGRGAVLASLALGALVTLASPRGRAFFSNAVRRPRELPSSDLERALLAALATLLAAIFVDDLSPLPKGWDALTQYLLVARTIAETGSLAPSQLGTGYELVLAQALVATDDMTFALLLCGFVPALLGLVVLHGVLRRHHEALPALCGTLLLACVPLWTFQAAEESKVDLMALAALSGAWYLLDAPRSRWATGALLAAAVAIKATVVLGAGALLFAQAVGMRDLRSSVLIALASVVAFLPFAIRHGVEAGSFAPRALLAGGAPLDPTCWQDLVASGQALVERSGPSGSQLEMRRYAHELALDLRDGLLWPWRATVQSHGVRSDHVDPGFLPLAVLPWLLVLALHWFARARCRAGTDGRLVLFALAAWTLWALTCEQILWYGLPGFLAFALVVARFASRAPPAILVAASSLAIAVTFVARARECGKPLLLAWASGRISTSACEAHALPLAEVVRARLRSDPEARVLAAGTPYAWIVPRAAQRLTTDSHQDMLGALGREEDPSLLHARLLRLGIRYVLFDRNVPPGPRDMGEAAARLRLERTLAHCTDLLAESRERGHAFYAVR